jgi:hypothetical protein
MNACSPPVYTRHWTRSRPAASLIVLNAEVADGNEGSKQAGAPTVGRDTAAETLLDIADDAPHGTVRKIAAAGSAVFFALAPGAVAGLGPWLLTRWPPGTPFTSWPPGWAVLIHAFARFVAEGLGTPAPVAPTAHLVVAALDRYVRNFGMKPCRSARDLLPRPQPPRLRAARCGGN